MSETTSIDVLANEVGNMAKNFVEFKEDNRSVITEFKEETRAANLRIENKVDKVDDRIDNLDIVTKEELDHIVAYIKSDNDSVRGQLSGQQGQINALSKQAEIDRQTVTTNQTSNTMTWLNIAKFFAVLILSYGALFIVTHYGSPHK